ncbi:intraflagellar transport protein 46 homolog isoform X2 [Zootermopsis nevadensis]|uniref:intraflagellar transport protein 46 homolog isoform X2 n=1 Tax=Zootermopsis nevadensis TaxID=136037 RepID=UPI000B8EE5A3|nr:intraflagellar transport protein 46 homolog isoform X2 [Zootermopsis nevadensis]
MSGSKDSDNDESPRSKSLAGPSNDVAILGIQRPGSSHISAHHRMTHQIPDHSDNSEDDDDDDDDDDVDVQAATLEGTYDPNEFNHLPVSAEVKDLFQNITRYTPQNIELDYKLRPFIPDFIPAVGDIDAFLKISRPDGKSDSIGLTVLDEPCAKQSEPAVLHLQLRAVAKQSSAKAVVVKKVECAEKNTKAIDRWIKDISDLHRSKPPPTVHYSKPMPDIDYLMQEWPADVEQQLGESGLPIADLDCDLPRYVDIVCSLFDIPVYESRIESLHVLFTLYSAVKSTQYINSSQERNIDTEEQVSPTT